MTIRTASCSCGQLTLKCEGDPVRISMCHCFACQQRTGSAFSIQARFDRSRVSSIEGRSTEFTRTGDEGTRLTFHFCPTCGSTVYFEQDDAANLIAVPVGAFADPSFPPPTVSVYESRRHPWTRTPDLKVQSR